MRSEDDASGHDQVLTGVAAVPVRRRLVASCPGRQVERSAATSCAEPPKRMMRIIELNGRTLLIRTFLQDTKTHAAHWHPHKTRRRHSAFLTTAYFPWTAYKFSATKCQPVQNRKWPQNSHPRSHYGRPRLQRPSLHALLRHTRQMDPFTSLVTITPTTAQRQSTPVQIPADPSRQILTTLRTHAFLTHKSHTMTPTSDDHRP